MQLQYSQPVLCPSQKLLRSKSSLQLRRWLASKAETLQAGDRAMLRYRNEALILTKPLRPEGVTHTRFGDVCHNSMIGMRLRDIVTTSKRWGLRVQLPTLNEYVRLTPRLVTPVYPEDANVIVSLLDLHPTSQLDSACPPMEVLEAGTGHGALTLYLARAIHAANLPVPVHRASRDFAKPDETPSDVQLPEPRDEPVGGFPSAGDAPEPGCTGNSMRRRHAIIHSLDSSQEHSRHARKIFQDFRRGLYSNDVEFHVGDVSDWVDKEVALRASNSTASVDRAFLSHIILDLPSSHTHAMKAASVLHVDGNLVVFAPSITQIVNWVDEIRKKKLPLLLDQVVELGHGISGGRQWDVRAVKPRALLQTDSTKVVNVNPVQSKIQEGQDGQDETAAEASQSREDDDFGWEVVCRPKVGDKVIGGGFVALWKKMRECTD